MDDVVFASKEFLIFLPLVLLVYHLLPQRGLKYSALLLASWVFYSLCSPGYLWVILALTVTDYVAALRIEANTEAKWRKRWLALSILSNLGLLAAFKYTAFAVDSALAIARWGGWALSDRHWEILLPLGISFHTFQGISYTVDVYRRQIAAVRSFRDYALFVAFFPQLAAGPIVRAVEFLPQMAQPPRVGWLQIDEGMRLVLSGLFKKLLIADQLHQLIVDPVFSNPTAFDSSAHRWAAIAWAVQIYCDFSGYTDLALGTARWFGFVLPPNFHLPYLATSITDFWRRWHVSLSTWLRDYLYFPLGGSRGSAVRTYANLLLVFILCGLWHGAAWSWFVYGAYNGLLMSLHRAFDRCFPTAAWRAGRVWIVVAWAATSYQLLLGLVLIRMPDWTSGGLILRSLLGWGWQAVNPPPFPPFAPLWLGAPLALVWLLGLGLSGHIAEVVRAARVVEAWPRLYVPARAVAQAVAVVLLITLAPGVTKSFIYIAF